MAASMRVGSLCDMYQSTVKLNFKQVYMGEHLVESRVVVLSGKKSGRVGCSASG